MTLTATAVAGVADGAVQVRARFEWMARPEGIGALVAVAAAALVFLAIVALYRRERAASASRLRWVCCGLRILCLCVLGVILLRPSIAYDAERLQQGLVVVLADNSASMSIRDVQPATPRAELAEGWAQTLGLLPQRMGELRRQDILRAILAPEGAGLIGTLSQANRVDLMTFAGSAHTVLNVPRQLADETADSRAPTTDLALPDWDATGSVTDLAGAVRAALEQALRTDSGQAAPLAAIVVLTDGRQTAVGDLQAAASEAAERSVPVHFVGIGSPSAPRNVALAELVSNDSTLAGFPLDMRVLVRSEGYEGQVARLVLTATEVASGRSHEVVDKPITLEGGGRRRAIDLTHVPPASGVLRYSARIEPLPGEFRTEDNAVAREVTVAEGKVRVLFVAGAPSREFRFLKSLLERDPAYDLTVRLHGAAHWPGSGAAWPPERKDLLPYSVVFLCDPAPEDVPAVWLEMLAELVDREGLGLAFLAGPTYTPELTGGAESGKLGDLLPVVVDAARTRALIGAPGYFTESWPVELADPGMGHPITNPGPGTEAARFWAEQPGLFWSLPVEREKPGAAVLLRWGDPASRDRSGRAMILAAVQPYGLGRAFYCGSPETWRWRRRSIEHYERFWLQVVRHCAGGRLAGRRKQAEITLDRSSYGFGEPVSVSARLFDERFGALQDEQVELGVERDGVRVGQVVVRRAQGEEGFIPSAVEGLEAEGHSRRAAEGLYSGVFYPEGFGHFELTYTAPGGVRVAEPFVVRQPEVEFKDPRLDGRTMQQVAAATGGRVFGPDGLDELAAAIPDLSRTVVEPGPLEPLWDTPYLLALLIAALGAEWLLRKRMGLL